MDGTKNVWVNTENFTLYCARWDGWKRDVDFVGVVFVGDEEHPISFNIQATRETNNVTVRLRDNIPTVLPGSALGSASAVMESARWLAEAVAKCPWDGREQRDFFNSAFLDQLVEKMKPCRCTLCTSEGSLPEAKSTIEHTDSATNLKASARTIQFDDIESRSSDVELPLEISLKTNGQVEAVYQGGHTAWYGSLRIFAESLDLNHHEVLQIAYRGACFECCSNSPPHECGAATHKAVWVNHKGRVSTIVRRICERCLKVSHPNGPGYREVEG